MDDKTLTWQQKVWKWIGDFVYGIKPLLLYLLLPPAISAFGLYIAGLRDNIEFFLLRSGQFYRTLGLLLVFYLMWRGCRKRGVSIWDETTLYWKELNVKKLLFLLGAGAGLNLFMSAALTVIPFPAFLIGPYHEMTYEVFGGIDRVLAILSVMFLAPLVEELIFRGYVLNRFLRRFESQSLSVLLCTGIFAACHVTPLWVAYGFFIGLLMAHFSIAEDNIIYSVALHMGYNIMTLPVWFANESQQASAVLFASPVLIMIYGIIGISVAVLCFRQYPLDVRQLMEYFPQGKKERRGVNENYLEKR